MYDVSIDGNHMASHFTIYYSIYELIYDIKNCFNDIIYDKGLKVFLQFQNFPVFLKKNPIFLIYFCTFCPYFLYISFFCR